MKNIKFITTTDELDGLSEELQEKLHKDLRNHDAAAYIIKATGTLADVTYHYEYVDITCIGLNVRFEGVILTKEEAHLRVKNVSNLFGKSKLFADNLNTSASGKLIVVETANEETRELLEVMKSYR
jgi:hypothetical protein